MDFGPLSSEVISKLRSGVVISNPSQCLSELVLNAIDASATNIVIHLDLSCYKIQVRDNGKGISANQLASVGKRYYTSKCHTLKDLNNLKYFGFRGEALASLCEISAMIEIVSRSINCAETYCKVFVQGRSSGVTKASSNRPQNGTTITVLDLLYNLPVRRKMISQVLDVETCRNKLAGIALIHPNISFTLFNDLTEEIILQTHKSNSVLINFSTLFGQKKAKFLKKYNYSLPPYNMNGYISLDSHNSKDHQFIYINNHLVLKTKLHKIFNFLLRRYLLAKHRGSKELSGSPNLASPSRRQDNAIFIINISCPFNKYDLCLEPQKSLVEFKEWNTVYRCIEESVSCFLKENNVIVNEPVHYGRFIYYLTAKDVCSDVQNIDIHNAKNALFSLTAKRKISDEQDNNEVMNNESTGTEDEDDEIDQSDEMPLSGFDISNIKSKSYSDVRYHKLSSVTNSLTAFKNKIFKKKLDSNMKHKSNNKSVDADMKIVNSKPNFTKNTMQSLRYKIDQSELTKIKSSEKNKTVNKNEEFKDVLTNNFFSEVINHHIPNLSCKNHEPFFMDNQKINTDISIDVSRQKYNEVSKNKSNEKDVNNGSKTSPFLNKVFKSELYNCDKHINSENEILYYNNTEVSHQDNQKESLKLIDITSDMNSCSKEKLISKSHRLEDNYHCKSKGDAHIDSMEENNTDIDKSDLNNSVSSNSDNKNEINNSMSNKLSNEVENEASMIKNAKLSVKLFSNEGLFYYGNKANSKYEIHNKNSFLTKFPHIVDTRDINTSKRCLIDEKGPAPCKKWICHKSHRLNRNVYVDRITGNSTYNEPETDFSASNDATDENTATSTKSHFFLSHNATPFLPRPSLQRKTSWTKFVEEKLHLCQSANSKSRVGVTNWTIESDISDGDDIFNLFYKWENPVFQKHDLNEIPNLSLQQICKATIKVYNLTRPHYLSKADLNHVKVIGQVDNKFIACKLSQTEENKRDNSLIVLFDQHAIHERIRLEGLIQDLYEEKTKQMKSSSLQFPINLQLRPEEIRVIKAYNHQLNEIGLKCSIKDDMVSVSAVPSCLVENEANENKKGESGISTLVEKLIQELVQLLLETGRITKSVPKTIRSILNSQACHGAIRFGDPLTKNECLKLLHLLSSCTLPFQCAHGRPALVPLVDFAHLEKLELQKVAKPHLWKIDKRKSAFFSRSETPVCSATQSIIMLDESNLSKTNL